MLLEKAKNTKERFCKHLQMQKKLGGYRNIKDSFLKKYGISIVQRKDEKGIIEEAMIIEEEEMVLAPFGRNHQFHFEVIETGQNEEYLLIATGEKVFKRWKDKKGIVEISELKGFHWFRSYGTEGILFQEDRTQLYNSMLWNSGKITEINGRIRPVDYWGYPVMDAGIEILDWNGFTYVYMRDDEIVISGPFQKRFEGYKYEDNMNISSKSTPNRFQINRRENGKWKIYEVTKESGIIEWRGEWDSVEPVEGIANTYIATKKGKDTGEILELPLPTSNYLLSENRKPFIYEVPGIRCTSIGIVDNIQYYEIRGAKKGKLYLAKFDKLTNAKLQIVGKYEGDALQISKSGNKDLEGKIKGSLNVVEILV